MGLFPFPVARGRGSEVERGGRRIANTESDAYDRNGDKSISVVIGNGLGAIAPDSHHAHQESSSSD